MSAREKVYHVNTSDSEWWKGEEEGGSGSLMEAKNKDLIVQRMEEKAKLNRPSKLVIHSVDGCIEYEESFDDASWKMGSMDESLKAD